MCTQDPALRIKLRETSPFVPVVFCHTSGLQMAGARSLIHSLDSLDVAGFTEVYKYTWHSLYGPSIGGERRL